MPRTARISRDLPPRSAVKAQERADRKDEGHLRRIRQLPCAACLAADPTTEQPAGEAHHLKAGRYGKGMKMPDRDTIPLCWRHHRIAEDTGQPDEWVLANTGVHTRDLADALWRARDGDMLRVLTAMIDRARTR